MQVTLFAKAVKALVRRPHSEAEVRDKLLTACLRKHARQKDSGDGKEVCRPIVDNVITQLRSQHLLDDAGFASWHVQQRSTYRPRSSLELRGELSRKGLARPVADSALEGHSDVAAAAKLALRRAKDDDKSLMTYLARKGFSVNVVRAVVAARGTEGRLEDMARAEAHTADGTQ